jgi:chromosomal replication initiator protein
LIVETVKLDAPEPMNGASFWRQAVNKPDAVNLWGKARMRLSEILHPDVFTRWIAVIEAHALTDSTLHLCVGNDFYQTWLEENYLPLIKDAVSSCAGTQLDIQFVVNTSMVPATPPPEPATPPAARRSPFRDRMFRRPATRSPSPLNPKYTFDQFIVGPSNLFAHAAALAVAQAPARAYNPLFIYGATGLGKTHLMQAIGHHVLATSRAAISYVSTESFTNEYIDALQNNAVTAFRKKYRSTDLLLIDDIHFLSGKEGLQEEFFHTFNALWDSHKQIVMTSDRPASEIARLEQRLVSRFEWGQVTELESPDLETRIAILRHKQASAPTPLPDEFLQYIAQHIRTNIRFLEGALVRTLSYQSLTGKSVTLEGLDNLLRHLFDQEKQEEVTFERIQRAVAEHFDIRLGDMSSKRRPRAVAVPRQVAMYLCRRMTRSSLPDIANAFGKTHATVLHAYKAVDTRMDVDAGLRQDVLKIAQKLGRSLETGEVNRAPVNIS